MPLLSKASNHLAQEIERTRQHLTNLEQAFDSLKPLISIDAAPAPLPNATSPAEPVEDIAVVNVEVPAKKAVKSKSTAKDKKVKLKAEAKEAKEAKEAVVEAIAEPMVKLPPTGAELWLKCIGRRKVSVSQIADAALTKLKLDDSARSVMTTRAKAWVYAAVKKGDLIAAGTRDGHKLYQLAPVKAEKVAEDAPVSEAVEVTPVAEGNTETA
jgi:hypothetical protein